jgi:hypothetical protein
LDDITAKADACLRSHMAIEQIEGRRDDVLRTNRCSGMGDISSRSLCGGRSCASTRLTPAAARVEQHATRCHKTYLEITTSVQWIVAQLGSLAQSCTRCFIARGAQQPTLTFEPAVRVFNKYSTRRRVVRLSCLTEAPMQLIH